MNEQSTTFERLASTLESSERQEMLRQLAEVTELQSEELSAVRGKDDESTIDETPARTKLSDESFWVRLWFKIKSFFSANSSERLYDIHLVNELGRALSRMCPEHIDTKRNLYLNPLCDDFIKLRNAQLFFGPLLSAYEEDKGDFFIILSSLMMKNTCDAISVASDPFSIPYRQDQKKDVRTFLLREMDSVLQSVPEEERGRMYQSAQALSWIRMFCELPLERMIVRFGVARVSGNTSGANCLTESISTEMENLVSVFTSAKRIPVLLLEALFLYSRQGDIENKKFDLEAECRQFVSIASGHLIGIQTLKATLPLLDFVRYTVRDISWVPTITEAGEDWFMLFKLAWKSRFEGRWSQWNKLHKRAMLERNICGLLEIEEIHALKYHPWDSMWVPLALRRELSLCFLRDFFSLLYPSRIMRPLKILMLDGDFYRRENQVEYTDAFNSLEHQQQIISLFEERLSSEGDLGESFKLVKEEKIATMKGKIRLDSLMLSADSEVDQIINRTVSSFRSLDLILGGILDVVRGGPYETLSNLATIQGKFNERYRKDLSRVRQYVRDALAIISEAEVIEKDSL
jgi:hypothetical protein